MRSCLYLASKTLSFLTVLVMLLTVRAAVAGTEADGGCVKLVRENKDAYAVTIGWSCDLREAVRKYPQLDADTGRPLPAQVQLRSIFAENQRRAQESGLARSPVRLGCVPARKAPADASPEELSACPSSVANYFGVASFGAQHTIIWIPKSRVPSTSERLEALGRSACSAIGAIEHLAGQLPDGARHSLEAAASDCGTAMPKVTKDAAEKAAASSEPPGASVTELTRELEQARVTVGQLQSQLRNKDTQAALVAPKLQTLQWLPALGVALAALLLANLLQALWHLKQRRAMRDQRQVLVDRDRLARALRSLEDEFDTRVEAIRRENEATIEQLRVSAAQLEVELLETAASQAEANREAEERRWSVALEQSQAEVTQRLQRALEETREDARKTLQELGAARTELARLRQNLQRAEHEAAQNLRRATSLEHRLQMARTRNAYLEASTAPDGDSRESGPELVVAAGA